MPLPSRRPREIFSHIDFQYNLDFGLQISAFQTYLEGTEDFISNKIDVQLQEFERLAEAQVMAEDSWYDAAEHYQTIFVQELYYNSFFISLYSLFEKTLYKMCITAEKHFIVKVSDLKGDGIKTYVTYLKKVAALDLAPMSLQWEFITVCQKLRNVLIHSPQNQVERNDVSALKPISAYLKIVPMSSNPDSGSTCSITDKKLFLRFARTMEEYLDFVYYEPQE